MIRIPQVSEKKSVYLVKTYLVGGWTNPFEKYARQIGSFP